MPWKPGRTQREIIQLIVQPSVSVSDECVDLCRKIIANKVEEEGHETDEAAPFKRVLWPCGMTMRGKALHWLIATSVPFV